MAKMLDESFAAAGRCPDMVLSGHVHSYQRFSRTLDSWQIPYIVCGAGGYHNLHAMATDATPGMQVAPDLVLEQFDATQYGFLRLAVSSSSIIGEYTGVSKEGAVTKNVDSFTVPVG